MPHQESAAPLRLPLHKSGESGTWAICTKVLQQVLGIPGCGPRVRIVRDTWRKRILINKKVRTRSLIMPWKSHQDVPRLLALSFYLGGLFFSTAGTRFPPPVFAPSRADRLRQHRPGRTQRRLPHSSELLSPRPRCRQVQDEFPRSVSNPGRDLDD